MAKLPIIKQNEPTEAPRTGADIARDVARAAFQGATLGLSDEIYGAFKAFTSDKSFEEARKEVIEGLEAYRERDPVAAYGFEILGGLFTGGMGAMGVARTGMTLGKAAKLGAAEGAIGGAATGETAGERAAGAVIGAPLGAGLGAFAEKIMPTAKAGSKAMLERGYPLTMGQYYGDPLSSVEQKISLPFLQEGINTARRKPQQMFMNEAVNDALAPLGIKANPSLSGNELIDFVEMTISDAYQDVVPKAKLNTFEVDEVIEGIIEDNMKVGSFDADDVKKFRKEIADSFVKYKTDGELIGDSLKRSESKMSTKIRNARLRGDDIMQNALKKVQGAFRAEVSLQNKHLPDLQAVNKAFHKTRDIVKLSERRVGTGGEVTPSMLARERTKTLGRQSPEAMKARQAAEVLGATVPDTGSAGRFIASQAAGSPLKSIAGMLGLGLATSLYEFPSLGRQAARLPSGLLQASTAELARTPARMMADTPRLDITLDDRQRSLLGQ